jgi:hypothetical protein
VSILTTTVCWSGGWTKIPDSFWNRKGWVYSQQQPGGAGRKYRTHSGAERGEYTHDNSLLVMGLDENTGLILEQKGVSILTTTAWWSWGWMKTLDSFWSRKEWVLATTPNSFRNKNGWVSQHWTHSIQKWVNENYYTGLIPEQKEVSTHKSTRVIA